MDLTQEWHLQEFENHEERGEYRSIEEEYQIYSEILNGNVEFVEHFISTFDFDEEGITPFVYSKDRVMDIRYRFTTFIAVISRLCVRAGMEQQKSYRLASFYVQKMDETQEYEEIRGMFLSAANDYCQHMKERSRDNNYSKAVTLCLDYIYGHLHDRIKLREIADYLGISESYLSKIFHKEVGLTISQYVMERKIEKAQNLLKYSDFSEIEIANYLSFSSQSHFIQTFQKKTGLTPLKYRNQNFRGKWS